MKKTKNERLVLFSLNLGSYFTEIGFIQKESQKDYQKNGRDGNIFCRNSNYMTSISSSNLIKCSI